jgi:hypothetical protein
MGLRRVLLRSRDAEKLRTSGLGRGTGETARKEGEVESNPYAFPPYFHGRDGHFYTAGSVTQLSGRNPIISERRELPASELTKRVLLIV